MNIEELKKEAEEYAKKNGQQAIQVGNFFGFEDEVKALKINAYLAGSEPREKRINELETMLHAWVQKYAELESTKEELVKSNQTIRSKLRTLKNDYEEYETAHIALGEKYRELEQENAELKKKCYKKAVKDYCELEKENAELKLKLEALDGEIPWNDIKDKSEVVGQLTKAKELLKRCYDNYIYLQPLRGDIEQFLKDNEVKK